MVKLVIGGGLSGLSAGYYLSRKFPKDHVKILEKSDRVGGWVKSSQLPDGTIFEQGPRTIRAGGYPASNTLKLIEELNLVDKLKPITRSHPAATNRMIYVDNNLVTLPSKVTDLLKVKKPFSKPLIYYLLKEWMVRSKKAPANDESIYSFVNRRLGSEIADYLISPMICGICAGNAKEISVRFLLSSLFEKEQKYGSISAGLVGGTLEGSKVRNVASDLLKRSVEERWSVFCFDQGMEILPATLKERLLTGGNSIGLNVQCTAIKFGKNIKVKTDVGDYIVTDHVISAVPASSLSKVVRNEHPALSDLLDNIKTVSVAVVNLKYDRNIIENEGFGFLVPPKENLPILGITYDSCCRPGANDCTVLTVMLGGYWFKDRFGENPAEDIFLDTATKHVKQIFKVDVDPALHKVSVLKNCIPQYNVGHHANLMKIDSYIKEKQLKLSLCGSSYHGVGINDVILSAKKAVELL